MTQCKFCGFQTDNMNLLGAHVHHVHMRERGHNKFHDLAANIAFSIARCDIHHRVITITLDEPEWIELLSLPEIDGDLVRHSDIVQRSGGVKSITLYGINWTRG